MNVSKTNTLTLPHRKIDETHTSLVVEAEVSTQVEMHSKYTYV